MKSFKTHCFEKAVEEFVESVAEGRINGEAIAHLPITVEQDMTQDQLVNELLGGLGNLAKHGAGFVGRSFKNVAKDSWNGFKQGLAGSANQVANGMGQVQGIYQQGERISNIQAARKGAIELADRLKKMGVKADGVDTYFGRIMKVIGQAEDRARGIRSAPSAAPVAQPAPQVAQPQYLVPPA